MKRRDFLQKAGLSGVLIGFGQVPLNALVFEPEITKLTILHTNDVHSRINPFPMDGGRNQGLGGAVRRAALIEKIRKEEEHVMLFDCGDIFQGTPYFKEFKGEVEIKLMSQMKYDGATMGNHDFDAGIDGFFKQLPHANFPIITSNYDFSDTVLNGAITPYRIFQKGKVKIGVFGLGIELKGLVPETLYKSTQYLDPISVASKWASRLKHDEKCDYVICLSHLGYKYRSEKISDVKLASMTKDIDLILGGHTHTFMDRPDLVKNLDGKKVYVNQAGWAGIMLGRVDIYFERNLKNKCLSCGNLLIDEH